MQERDGFRSALALAAGLACAAAHADPPMAVASIRPVHSLLAGVMAGVAEPRLLLRAGESPHTYALRPSDAAALAAADLVVRIGPGLESFLDRPLRELTPEARLLTLTDVPGLTRLPVRRGGLWEEHAHGSHGDERHDEHHGEHHDEPHDDHRAERRDDHHDEHHDERHDERHDEHHGERHDDPHDERHDEHHGEHHDERHDDHRAERHGEHDGEREPDRAHGDGPLDPHVWLDPRNAAAMVRAMAAELARLDPENEARYRENQADVEEQLRRLDEELRASLAPVAERGFLVFHDAWQYLDARYGLRAVGSFRVAPERAPGAARLVALRRKLAERDVVCVFSEPQFSPRLVAAMVADSGASFGVLDPLGAELPPGPGLYFGMMRANAEALRECLEE